MKRQKMVFIIPGFRHKPTSRGYKIVAKMLKTQGYKAVPITIPWKQSTILENTEHFLKEYKKRVKKSDSAPKSIYLFGFSYGAIIALVASTKISVKGLILCSLSPYFKEDLPKTLPKNISFLEQERYRDFTQLNCRLLAKKIKAKKTMMLYGQEESKPLIRRVRLAFRHIPSPKKYLYSIEKTYHNIADKKYLSAIEHAAQQLN